MGRDVTRIAIRARDIKVPYAMKKAMVRPVLMGLRAVLLEHGDLFIQGLGRFYVRTKQVSIAIGSRTKRPAAVIHFRPVRGLAREVAKRWGERLQAAIVAPEGVPLGILPAENEATTSGPALSADGEGLSESSAAGGGAPDASSTT